MERFFVENIDVLLEAVGKKRSELLRDLNLPDNTISNWIKRRNIPSADIIKKISDYFGVPMEFILYGQDAKIPSDIIAAEAKLMTLSEEKRKPIIAIISTLVDYWKVN